MINQMTLFIQATYAKRYQPYYVTYNIHESDYVHIHPECVTTELRLM